MSEYIFEGTGKPKIIFANEEEYSLPEPNGKGKVNLRKYRFVKIVRDSYLSEANTNVEIGVSYEFECELRWLACDKNSAAWLRKAQNEDWVTLVLNDDEPSLNFKVRVSALDISFPEGRVNHKAGYSATIVFKTIENLPESGYSQISGADYGAK
ncbi:MAG: hypothetical protein K1X86_15400 [Ignavibacteria bacterium]|nr:hypothetical protein [Ignavibacteria bacterium]